MELSGEDITFTAELAATGGNTTGFTVPDEVVEALGAGRRPKVVVTLGGHTWRTTIASMGGCFMLGVSLANRRAAEATAGQTYPVHVRLDTAPRTVTVPDDLAAALQAAGVRQAWDRLSYTHQREHVEAVEQARRPDTRSRRIVRAVDMVRGPGGAAPDHPG